MASDQHRNASNWEGNINIRVSRIPATGDQDCMATEKQGKGKNKAEKDLSLNKLSAF
jgi:hypothetical protein